jgi:hypothetical protein
MMQIRTRTYVSLDGYVSMPNGKTVQLAPACFHSGRVARSPLIHRRLRSSRDGSVNVPPRSRCSQLALDRRGRVRPHVPTPAARGSRAHRGVPRWPGRLAGTIVPRRLRRRYPPGARPANDSERSATSGHWRSSKFCSFRSWWAVACHSHPTEVISGRSIWRRWVGPSPTARLSSSTRRLPFESGPASGVLSRPTPARPPAGESSGP